MILVNIQLDKKSVKGLSQIGLRNKLLKKSKIGTIFLVKELKISALSLKKSRQKGYKGQSGKLAQSITFKPPYIRGNEIVGEVGSNMKYAKIQDVGGVITPKSKAALTVPFPGRVMPPGFALKGSGTTFIYKDIIFLNTGEKPTPIYMLKRSVTIPATHWIGKAVQKATPRILKLFKEPII